MTTSPVCIAQSADELGLDVQTLQHVADLRPAAVHQHDLDTHQRQQHDIVHDCLLQRLVGHGVSAVLDHQNFVVVFLNVRQSIHQHLCPHIVMNFSHFLEVLS